MRKKCPFITLRRAVLVFVFFVLLGIQWIAINTRQPNHNKNYSKKQKSVKYQYNSNRTFEDDNYEDIMNMKPIRFLPNYKNPCWIGEKDNGPINDGKIHCLPYFYIMDMYRPFHSYQLVTWVYSISNGGTENQDSPGGVLVLCFPITDNRISGNKKSGTTDLFHNIMYHPDAKYPGFKEAQWFARIRFNSNPIVLKRTRNLIRLKTKDKIDYRKLEYYIHMFQRAATAIEAKIDRSSNSSHVDHQMIMGEGSPSYLYLLGKWKILPGNKGLQEPKYTNLHYIRHLYPNAKIIVLYRNPVDRLYSDYRHTHRLYRQHDKSPETFHTAVKQAIELYENCFELSTMRSCIYNNTIMTRLMTTFSFTTGFYAFFMKELLNVFPKEQILPLLFDDYTKHQQETVSSVFNFLGLKKLDRNSMEKIVRQKTKNTGGKKDRPMLSNTRKLLEEFYQPYNKEMAELMDDFRYLFT